MLVQAMVLVMLLTGRLRCGAEPARRMNNLGKENWEAAVQQRLGKIRGALKDEYLATITSTDVQIAAARSIGLPNRRERCLLGRSAAELDARLAAGLTVAAELEAVGPDC